MSLEARVEGVEELKGYVGELKKNLVNGEILRGMAQEARQRVLERTGEGKDIHATAFKPYSKSHRKAREKKGLSGTRVDLRYTGGMLGGMRISVEPDVNESNVSFSDGKNASKAAHLQRGSAGREFFGLGDAEQDGIREMLEDHIGEVIKDAY